MHRLKKLFKPFRDEDTGAVTVEYVAIGAFIAAIILSSLGTITTEVGNALDQLILDPNAKL
jgi:Flp pilus assembly pilin Flp